MKNTFDKGDTVYSIDGDEGTYLINTGNGHLVFPHYETDDGPFSSETAETWKQVFESSPRPVKEAAIAELDAKKKEIQEAINTLRTEERQAKESHAATLKKLASYPALADLEAFIDGRLTHVVVSGKHGWRSKYSVQILPIGELESQDESEEYRDGKYRKPLRLLSLLGKSKPEDMEWRLYGYSSTSSNSELVYPFASEEEAKAKAAELIAPAFENISPKFLSDVESAIASAKRIGMPVPEAALALVRKCKEESRLETLRNAEAAYEKAKAQFAASSGVEVES